MGEYHEWFAPIDVCKHLPSPSGFSTISRVPATVPHLSSDTEVAFSNEELQNYKQLIDRFALISFREKELVPSSDFINSGFVSGVLDGLCVGVAIGSADFS